LQKAGAVFHDHAAAAGTSTADVLAVLTPFVERPDSGSVDGGVLVTQIPNELVVGFLTLTLSAKGPVALWMAVPVSAILIALAWRIWRPRG